MTQKVKEKIILCALDLAAAQGWDRVTLALIAERSGVSVVDIHDIFDDKADILAGFGRMIDRQILADRGETLEDARPRELLFDLLMDRFDALNDHKDGVRAVLESFKYDPKQALVCLPHLCKTMSWMLESSGVSTHGFKGMAKVVGLMAVYLKAAKAWMDDDTADMAKTMACLDQDLSRVEGWAETFGF